MEKFWKYTKEKPRFNFDEYFKVEEGKPCIVVVKSPEIIKKDYEGNYRSVFTGTVVEMDGQPMDKFIVINNYENVMFLKKKIAKKKEIKMELTRGYDKENMEVCYDIKILK
jgi:hypothetical protein